MSRSSRRRARQEKARHAKTPLSARRRAANRRNAQRSTGPRSAAGKARSSQNATTHGIFCRDLVLPGESKEIFEAFRDALVLRLNPQDILELLIVDRIVTASWKLRRLQATEQFIHATEAEGMHRVEVAKLRKAQEELNEYEDATGEELTDEDGTPFDTSPLARDLKDAETGPPAYERFPINVTLAVSLAHRTNSAFERLSRLEHRLERSLHRNMDELRRLRDPKNPAARLEPPVKRCPYAEPPLETEFAQEETEEDFIEAPEAEEADVQNEPNELAERAQDGDSDHQQSAQVEPLDPERLRLTD